MVTAAAKKTAPRERPVWAFGDRVLDIPPEAHTYEGFLDWVRSDDVPEKLRVTFASGEVSVEIDDSNLLVIPAQAHTYHGFLKWAMSGKLPEKLRVTFLDGEVTLDMTEESLQTHVAVKGAIYSTLFPIVTEEDLGEFYTDGTLVSNEAARVSNNPDGVAVLLETIKAKRVRFVQRKGVERAIEGSPDWVLEIVSESSVQKDTKKLRAAYHRARIPEYWVIDARGDDIVFQILLWRKKGYVASPFRDGWSESKVFARHFRLTRKRNSRGAWIYALRARRAGQ